jgi:hypothetical protein
VSIAVRILTQFRLTIMVIIAAHTLNNNSLQNSIESSHNLALIVSLLENRPDEVPIQT